jgi:CRISPR-associated protein Cas1
MIRRTVEISRSPCHLAVRDGQLLILRREGPTRRLPAQPENLAGSIPLEDLGVLVVDERDTTYTHTMLARMAEHGAALVVCGTDHLPCGMYLPLSGHTELLARLRAQITATQPQRKRLWSAIVAAKIRAQAANLSHAPSEQARLIALQRRIRSGDPENVEAQAARLYWPALLDDLPTLTPPFRRRPGDPGAEPPNNLLDYGYAILRAAVGRVIVSAGLLPALGLQHRQQSNAFCLADDLMEPLRPLVDSRVRQLAGAGHLVLDQPAKAEILGVLSETIRMEETSGPLEVALVRYVAGFAEALATGSLKLAIPTRSEGTLPDAEATVHDKDADECI